MKTKMIGSRISEARKKCNLSQSQLAQQLFISPQAVGKWERGESLPDILTLNRLAVILGVDLSFFSENSKSVDSEKSSEMSSNLPIPELESQMINKKPVWNMSDGNWCDADFSGLKNLHNKFSSSNLLRCKFSGSDLSGLILKGNNVDSCDFSNANIDNSHIQGSNMANNKFSACSLKESEFSGTNIENCDFSGALFTRTEFHKSFFNRCNFNGTDFSGVVFKYAGISGVKDKSGNIKENSLANAVLRSSSFVDTHIADIVFEGKLEDCIFENCSFTRVVFRNATIMNTFFKNNKKLKTVLFIDCKADRMTYEFLKSGKANMSGIKLRQNNV